LSEGLPSGRDDSRDPNVCASALVCVSQVEDAKVDDALLVGYKQYCVHVAFVRVCARTLIRSSTLIYTLRCQVRTLGMPALLSCHSSEGF
jgi:hypothetical protein